MERRIAALEDALVQDGCTTCEGWINQPIVARPGDDPRTQCPDCGRQVPLVIMLERLERVSPARAEFIRMNVDLAQKRGRPV